MENKVIVVSCIDGLEESRKNDSEFSSSIVKRHLRVIRNTLTNFKGELNEGIVSDNQYIIFDDAEEAINFAIEIQDKFAKHPRLGVQIGVGKGEFLVNDGILSGNAVLIATKIAESAKAGSIIVSSGIHEEIQKSEKLNSEFIDIYDWKERDLEIRMFAITEENLVVPQPEEIKAHIKPLGAEGLKRTSKISHILISIGTLIAASAIFAYLNVLSSEPVIDDYSIAVIPFNDLGSDVESQIISEAISKDILHNLSLLEDLYVISSYTSMQFKNSEKDKQAIAKELGVAFLLTGSSHKFGDNIRVSAQLTDVVSNKVIWNKSFNQPYKEVMQIESQISKEVVDALKLRLSFDDMQNLVGIPTSNITAYNAFIKARNESDKRTSLGNKNSIDLYSDAIRIDTSYAEAYANLAWSNLQKVIYNDLEPSNVLKLTELYLERAESINDQIPKIYMVRGALYNLTNDPVKAYSSLNKAIELAPNDAALRLEFAKYYKNTNQPKNQLQQNKLAYQLDPLNFDTAMEYVDALISNKEFDEADKLLENINKTLNEIDPIALDKMRVKLFLASQDYEKAISPLIRLSNTDKSYFGSLGYSYSKTSNSDMAYRAMDTLKAMDDSEVKFYNIAKIYAATGLRDSLYKYLDSLDVTSFIVKDSMYQFFENYKSDRRFNAILQPKTD